MIVSFRCDETKAIFNGGSSRKLQAVAKAVYRRLPSWTALYD